MTKEKGFLSLLCYVDYSDDNLLSRCKNSNLECQISASNIHNSLSKSFLRSKPYDPKFIYNEMKYVNRHCQFPYKISEILWQIREVENEKEAEAIIEKNRSILRDESWSLMNFQSKMRSYFG